MFNYQEQRHSPAIKQLEDIPDNVANTTAAVKKD